MKMYLSLVLFLVLSACGGRVSILPDGAVVISDHSGGLIQSEAKKVEQYRAAPQVRLVGFAASAGTMYLALPNVCVYPDTKLMFHGAWPKVSNSGVQRAADYQMGQYYPPNIKRLYMEVWRHKGANDFHTITGLEANRLDNIRLCS